MYLNIIETKNNIFVNLSNRKKKLVFQASGGMLHLQGRKRKTPLAGEMLGKVLVDNLALYNITKIGVCVHGSFSPVVRGVLRGLSSSRRRNMRFLFIEERKGAAHNGVRLKKKRRL